MTVRALPLRYRPILEGILAGKRTGQIAKEAGLEPKTVTAYKADIYEFAGVKTMPEFVAWASSKEKKQIFNVNNIRGFAQEIAEEDLIKLLVKIGAEGTTDLALAIRAQIREQRGLKSNGRKLRAVTQPTPAAGVAVRATADEGIPPKVLKKIEEVDAEQVKAAARAAQKATVIEVHPVEELSVELLDDKPLTMEDFPDNPNLPVYAREGMARCRALLEGQKIGEVK